MIKEPDSAPHSQPFSELNPFEYKLLVESLAEASWQTDASGTVLEDAPGWRAYTGQGIQQWMEEGWMGSVHPDNRIDVLTRWQTAVQNEEMLNVACRLQRPDGNWCWNDIKIIPVLAADGTVVKWVGACTDISELKQTRASFTQAETQLRLLTMLSSDTLYRMSADWHVMISLKGFDFLADTTRTNEKWFEQYIPEADQKRVRAAIDEAITAKSLFELEHQVFRADGSIGWTFSRAMPLLGTRGEITEWFGTARDITKRKIAEERKVFLLELSDKLRPLADSLDIQQTAAFLIGSRLKTDRVMYAEIAGAESEYLISRNYLASEEIIPVIGKFSAAPFGKWLIDEVKLGNTAVVNDVINDKRLTGAERDAFLGIGVRAFIITPLNKEGRWVAAMKIHQRNARQWTDLEVSLVGEVAERTWAAVQRAKAEEALAGSERRLRLAIDATELATWEWNLETDQVVWNAQHFRLHGMEVDGSSALPSAAFFDRLHPDDQSRVAAEIRRAIAENGLYDADFRIVRENGGAVRWMNGYGRVTGIVDGKPFRMSGVMFDITDRKQAEESLRHSEQQQRAILESAKDYAILTLDINRKVTSWNNGAEQILGFTEADMIGKSGDIVFVPEDRANSAPELEVVKALETGRYENERWHMRKDGSRFYGSGVTTPLLGESGSVIGVLKMMRDLTARKEAEQALVRSQERLQRALSIPTVGVLFFEENGSFTHCNEAFLRMSGFSRSEVEGGQLNINRMTLPDWMPVAQQALAELRSVGRSSPFERQLERPDGSRWWGLFAGTRLIENEYVEFVLDISYRKNAEEALLDADRRKDEFLALLAHELRNPMATLSNTLMVLELTGGMHDKLALDKAIAMMRREVVQLVRLVDDLLDVSRINQGKVTLTLEHLDFAALVKDAVLTGRPMAGSERRHLTVTLPAEPVYLNGDPARLIQAVRNLLSNAIKFTNEDGHIWVELTEEDPHAILRVRDDGIGIPADQLDRIFELFVQVNTSRTRLRDGLGLGLTLVKDFIEKHGGRIQVHSAGPETGSEFIVYLPLQTTEFK
ncbi:PAS domain S-box protein [Dyadobacter chenwenxiniae]|uniref:histidine kinase n=1 Tax=Dyadobacter chenwenxiniae TaxID=2906456 RepID=A0A9X1TLR6_9BACT|nr:PAS domain S-box protein [Dyadobacter chenwenxiniae]MCF0062653.1 PAS domain S-box protein [Dyadobacter chenwenxiniae]UON83603.1 PAS domain S-box protein [Dyadobacter chenwenxiniae]